MHYYISFYWDAFKLAVQSIFAHKLRAFLTLIGIIIGVASVVVVGASISGLNTYVLTTVSKMLGVNHFMMARIAFNGRMSQEQWERMDRRNKRLYWDDYQYILRNCPSCTEVGAELVTRQNLNHKGQELFGTRVSGVTANMVEIENKDIAEGRFLAQNEIEHASLVVVIGNDIREKFFQGVDPLGQELKVGGIPLKIVGVEAKRGSMFGDSLDNHLYLPITTYGHIWGRRQSLQIHGKASDRELLHKAIEDARLAMRNRHKLVGNEEDDFGLVNVEEVNNQVEQFTGTIAMVVTPITLLSLVVGGIVVMNIMLVSVTERTFEIGLRKALGARAKQILLQFLIESSLLSAIGGLFGLLLAAGLSWVITKTTPLPMTITVGYILLALLVSGGIGMIAGIYPAWKAAKLDPIVALTKS
ncbi:MAG TPA: ABC transporter permease [Blastocatellia bacterium]|nr:ABC transporter permease [Blastocatellia bacterium]